MDNDSELIWEAHTQSFPNMMEVMTQFIKSPSHIDVETEELKSLELAPMNVEIDGEEIPVYALKEISVKPEYLGTGIMKKVLSFLENMNKNVMIYDVIHSVIHSYAQKRGYERIESVDEHGDNIISYVKFNKGDQKNT